MKSPAFLIKFYMVLPVFLAGCVATTPSVATSSPGILKQLGQQSDTPSRVDASSSQSRTPIQIHVDEYGRMIYEKQFVTAETMRYIFQREKIGKGRAVTLIALEDVSIEKLFRCREALVAQGIPNIAVISSPKAASTGHLQ